MEEAPEMIPDSIDSRANSLSDSWKAPPASFRPINDLF